MIDFVFGSIIFFFGMMLSSFIGSTIIMCLLAGIGMMRKLENAGLLIHTNYKRYIVPVFFWSAIFILATLLIIFKTNYLIIWLIGSAYGFYLAFKKTLNRESLIPGIHQVCRDNQNIIIKNEEYMNMINQIVRDY